MDEPIDPQNAPPEPNLERRNRFGLSLVWIVPIAALIVGAVLMLRTLLESGPDITIEFPTAEGLQAGRTEVRYKEVVVGHVTRVVLSRDRQRVVASVSLDKSAASVAVEDTRFWVVRPRVGTSGVSGLGTLLSGAYIGVDAGVSEVQRRRFIGLDAAPFVLRGEPGRSFSLSADDLGSLDVGSPVYYRRARVGRVVGYTLDPAKDTLNVQVFIESPNERLVTERTRFWNASGVDLAFSANGLTLNTQSVASVLAGGVAFGSPPGPASAPAAPEGRSFHLFGTEQKALAAADGPAVYVRMVFAQSLRGLTVGAPVDLLGVEVGSVQSIALQRDASTGRFPVEVQAEIFPLRLGAVREAFAAPPGASAPVDHLFLKTLVDNGLRAQVRTGNLLTGQLYVALDFMPRAPKAGLDENAEVPLLPSVPGTLSDVQPQLAEIIGRLGKVRFDEIGNGLESTLQGATAATRSLQETLASANSAIRQLSPDAQQALADVRQTLASVQATLAGFDRNVTQSDAPLQRNANQALTELQRAAQALRVLSDYLQRHPEALLRGKPADPDVKSAPEGPR